MNWKRKQNKWMYHHQYDQSESMELLYFIDCFIKIGSMDEISLKLNKVYDYLPRIKYHLYFVNCVSFHASDEDVRETFVLFTEWSNIYFKSWASLRQIWNNSKLEIFRHNSFWIRVAFVWNKLLSFRDTLNYKTTK